MVLRLLSKLRVSLLFQVTNDAPLTCLYFQQNTLNLLAILILGWLHQHLHFGRVL
jgi:hypothetical protein